MSDLPPTVDADGDEPEPLGNDDAESVYRGLMELLRSYEDDSRMRSLIQEVTEVVAQGEPLGADVRVGQRKRERVRQVRPLTAREQLQLLVDAVHFTLIAPVDLAASARAALLTDEMPDVHLVFERDTAVDATARKSSERTDTADSEVASETITGDDIGAALEAVGALRGALDSIRQALNPE